MPSCGAERLGVGTTILPAQRALFASRHPIHLNYRRWIQAKNKPVVVVGVDGSANSVKALAAAMQEAVWRGAEVHAVNAWTYPYMSGMDGGGYVNLPSLETSASAALDQAIDEVRTDAPDRAVIKRQVVSGSPAESLIEASKDAELLVVGARGHGGFLGLLLGSVSSQVVKHAHCPVLVVPPDHD